MELTTFLDNVPVVVYCDGIRVDFCFSILLFPDVRARALLAQLDFSQNFCFSSRFTFKVVHALFQTAFHIQTFVPIVLLSMENGKHVCCWLFHS